MKRNADASGFRSITDQLHDTMFARPIVPVSAPAPSDRGERERATLSLYGDGKGRIPDEAAADLGRDFMVIRPACAILHGRGELVETGVKRRGRSKMARELKITAKGRDVLIRLGLDPLSRLLGAGKGAA